MRYHEYSFSDINFLDEIDKYELEYMNEFGLPVYNVSDWNSSKEFQNLIMEELSKSISINNLDYIFSYSIAEDTIHFLLEKLGFSKNKQSVLITHSGSTSIFNVVNLLHEKGIRRLFVFCPNYFSVFYACKVFNIECIPLYMKREELFQIEYDNILKIKESNCAFWVANPIYCAGVYYTDQDIHFFRELLQNSIVVFDECLCRNGKELCRTLGNEKNFIGIYCPQKTICINSFKFSIVVCNNIQQEYLDAWSDIICGCLNNSCDFAISHFLSDYFDLHTKIFYEKIHNNFNTLKAFCINKNIYFDKNVEGYLISLYFPRISAKKGLEPLFIKDALYKTGVRFIPGIRNHFDQSICFSFRVNLSKIDKRAIIAITNLVDYFDCKY